MALMISEQASNRLQATRPVYRNRSQMSASRNGYLDALNDIVNRANEANQQLPSSIIQWIEDNA